MKVSSTFFRSNEAIHSNSQGLLPWIEFRTTLSGLKGNAVKHFCFGRRGVRKMPVSPYARGIKAISRWLSEATPPELIASTIFESRRDSRLIRRFGVVSTMSLPCRVRSRWDRLDSTTSVPVASLTLSHGLIADVLPGRQTSGGTRVFSKKNASQRCLKGRPFDCWVACNRYLQNARPFMPENVSGLGRQGRWPWLLELMALQAGKAASIKDATE